MNQDQFLNITDQIFDALFKQLDDYELDVDILDGNIHIYTDEGEFLINKHIYSKQIWLSSPISGAHHFLYDLNTKTWLSSSYNEFLKVLSEELNLELKYV